MMIDKCLGLLKVLKLSKAMSLCERDLMNKFSNCLSEFNCILAGISSEKNSKSKLPLLISVLFIYLPIQARQEDLAIFLTLKIYDCLSETEITPLASNKLKI